LDERPSLDLIEEAIHVLRGAPAGLLALYYTGTVPFTLCFLFFWADMSASAFAAGRLIWFSAATAALYVWMKTWQAVFAIELRRHISGRGDPGWGWRRILRLARAQAAIQPTSLVALPACFVMTVPFPAALAFYQHALMAEGDGDATLPDWVRKSVRQSVAWGRQAFGLASLLGLLAFVVFINVGIALWLGPNLLKTLTGEEILFTRDNWSALNTTFLAITGALSYLCFDPVAKAAYALRTFYLESTGSGEDLRLEFRGILRSKAPAILAIAGCLWFAGGRDGRAENSSPAPPVAPATVSPKELDGSLRRVLKREEFAWRLPKATNEEASQKPGFIARFLGEAWDFVAGIGRWFLRQLDKWFRGWGRSSSPEGGRAGFSLKALPVVIIAALVVMLGVCVWFWLRDRKTAVKAAVAAAPVGLSPDLQDEGILPDRLPSDEWTRLALEMMAAGDLRRALRAFYLASLAHLAAQEVIRVAAFKSNRDYLAEVQRRTKNAPGLFPVFKENVEEFDRVWYGRYPVDMAIVSRFQANTRTLCS